MRASAASKLRVGFYAQTCPRAEALVREAFDDAVRKTDDIGADLLRMHFHDCFGCDGSILIASANGNTVEKDAEINQTIEEEAFQVVDNAKASLEAACPGVVSCADILAYVARDSVAHYGGGFYNVPAGRRDGRISLATDVGSESVSSSRMQRTKNKTTKEEVASLLFSKETHSTKKKRTVKKRKKIFTVMEYQLQLRGPL
ncbi:hypothetical protein ZIOFF_030615 [Zingiber officinale]|uniref:peroxidase n=1 Tax=Zingiber officinale TaxID=94328 RepID=A0A8J5H4Y0_ZINOF|nr:hypothetical protein ZIOFF_030615 [Zingiber officinale]